MVDEVNINERYKHYLSTDTPYITECQVVWYKLAILSNDHACGVAITFASTWRKVS